jgi:6-methylsalicylate decarboxylase
VKVDVHQHLWSERLVEALAERGELPFVRRERSLTVLYLAGERPYVLDLDAEVPDRRASLVELDGLDRALLCLSSPLGIESLARAESRALIDAYHEGALALRGPFGVWGAVPLESPDPEDVDRALEIGCVGISLPAGALASLDAITSLQPVLARLELLEAPLLVHPGPGPGPGPARAACAAAGSEMSLNDPLWWPALTHYIAGMQAAWLAFLTAGRSRHPRLRVIFTMLAGLAPVHAERLSSRGGPARGNADPLVFYDISSYGPTAVGTVEGLVGAEQLLYGSDRPVLEPSAPSLRDERDWDLIAEGTRRALGAGRLAAVR